MTPEEALLHYFGYTEFRHQQREIVTSILTGNDTLVLMPTGGGKSICYQLPAMLLKGLTLVVSPLIALMKDQVDALSQNGIEAAFLNSTLSPAAQEGVLWRIKAGELKMLYVAPERLVADKSLTKFLQQVGVAVIAIDEAHCISQWGHDFRPEYLALGEVKRSFEGTPVVALTATADSRTKGDIIQKLGMEKANVFEHSFNRPNIFYQVLPKKGIQQQLTKYLHLHKDKSGIIYCLSRKGTEEIAAMLQKEGITSVAYHAGLERNIREQRQEQFQRDEIKVMVATIAFGMGIDKSNVRFVIHADIPKNIEGYYQETGRAGRDGLPSDAILFYSGGDVVKLRRFIVIEDNAAQTRILERKLQQMADFCTLTTCRRKYLLNYFNEDAPDTCGYCDICRTQIKRTDGTVPAQMLLSAVSRLEERFGLNYVVDFLRGSSTTKVEHQGIKTYGAGQQIAKKQWIQYGKELIQQGFLAQSEDGYSILKLTPKSWLVLRGSEKVMLAEQGAANDIDPEERAKIELDHPELFKLLAEWRTRIAAEQNVPAFLVLSDASLVQLTNNLPLSIEDIRLISGFGEVKTQRYGLGVLEIIIDYAVQHNLQSRVNEQSLRKPRDEKKETGKPIPQPPIAETFKKSFQLYKNGNTIAQISELRGLSPSTIEGHLAKFIATGDLTVDEFVSKERQLLILAAAYDVGIKMLTPIKEKLSADISYGEIRMMVSQIEKVFGK